MEINHQILNKFNRYQDEILKYYNLLGLPLWTASFPYGNTMHTIKTFNILTLGYQTSKIDSGVDDGLMTVECFYKRIRYLSNKYPLLIPFYSFSCYLVQNEILQKRLIIEKKEVLEEINKNIQFARSHKYKS